MKKPIQINFILYKFEVSVHERSDLDAASMFAYLLSSTAMRAWTVIDGIPLTALHYPHAPAEDVGACALLGFLEGTGLLHHDTAGIQAWFDELTKHLICLASMGKDSHPADLLLSQALTPRLKESAGTEADDNMKNFLDFAQLQADSLSPTGGPGFEECG
ncbi:hypothetical protein T10_7569 [Trichinella papuae]|uniref:Uncharacterized protein n=1 Tax=Trichinella papuae TaxID=268474 RepID=A0A0V1M1T5_9BILA|nr:hypothetical protein T10_7569 [Trichinella papuae]